MFARHFGFRGPHDFMAAPRRRPTCMPSLAALAAPILCVTASMISLACGGEETMMDSEGNVERLPLAR